MYGQEWLTIYMLRGGFAHAAQHDGAYIILFLTYHNEPADEDKIKNFHTSTPCLTRSVVYFMVMTSQSIAQWIGRPSSCNYVGARKMIDLILGDIVRPYITGPMTSDEKIAHARTHAHTHARTRARARTRACMHARTHERTHTHIHTFPPICFKKTAVYFFSLPLFINIISVVLQKTSM